MSPALIKAHEKLDKLVDRGFGATSPVKDNPQREKLLFEQYLLMTQAFVI